MLEPGFHSGRGSPGRTAWSGPGLKTMLGGRLEHVSVVRPGLKTMLGGRLEHVSVLVKEVSVCGSTGMSFCAWTSFCAWHCLWRWMLVVAWGLNRGRCGLTMRERWFDQRRRRRRNRGGNWERRKRLWVWMREGWERLDLRYVCLCLRCFYYFLDVRGEEGRY